MSIENCKRLKIGWQTKILNTWKPITTKCCKTSPMISCSRFNIKKSLEHELKEKEGITEATPGAMICVQIVKELYCIINTNFMAGSTPQDNDLDHILSHIKYFADCLDDTTLQ